MKRLLIALALLAAPLPALADPPFFAINGGVPAPNPSNADAAVSVSTATTTEIVAAVNGKSIFIDEWDILVASADNITWEYGTGTRCGTGTTALTGAYNFAANGGLSVGDGGYTIMRVPPGNALCMVTSAGVQASGHVAYAQQ